MLTPLCLHAQCCYQCCCSCSLVFGHQTSERSSVVKTQQLCGMVSLACHTTGKTRAPHQFSGQRLSGLCLDETLEPLIDSLKGNLFHCCWVTRQERTHPCLHEQPVSAHAMRVKIQCRLLHLDSAALSSEFLALQNPCCEVCSSYVCMLQTSVTRHDMYGHCYKHVPI